MYTTVPSIRGNEWIMDNKDTSEHYTSLNKFHMDSKYFRFHFTVKPAFNLLLLIILYNGSYRQQCAEKNSFLVWTSFRCDDDDGCDGDDDDGDDTEKTFMSET